MSEMLRLTLLACALLLPVSDSLLDRADAALATRSASGLLEAERLYETVVEQDPALAEGHAGLAATRCLIALYSVEEPRRALGGARESARRAVELDPALAGPQAALGLVAYLVDRDWEGAEERFRLALSIDPADASAGHWYAMMLAALGRSEDSIIIMETALRASPDSRLLVTKMGTVLTAAGRFDEAARQLSEATQRFPRFSLAWRELGFLELARGNPEEAVPFFVRAAELAGDSSKSVGGLGHALARVGRRDEAGQILQDLVRRSQSEYVPAMVMAMIEAGLDDSEAALDWLEIAERQADPGLVYAGIKPGLEGLHGTPRFEALLTRLGLPPSDSRPSPW